MRSLAAALIAHGRIETTEAKAKALRPYIEKMITSARAPSLSTTRLLASRLSAASAKKLIAEIAPRYAARAGGYTRIRKLVARSSDGAPMAMIEFLP